MTAPPEYDSVDIANLVLRHGALRSAEAGHAYSECGKPSVSQAIILFMCPSRNSVTG